MIRKLELQRFLSSEKKNIITFNVGGQKITNQRTIFTNISNISTSQIINLNNENDVFIDYDPKLFQHLINQLRKQSFRYISTVGLSSKKEKISFETMLSDLNISVVTSTSTTNNRTTS